MRAIHFYTSCTLTKSVTPPPHLHLGDLRTRPSAERQRMWCARLDEWQGERVAAKTLYQGGHWSIVRGVAESQPDAECFVISAGYGLVSIRSRLVPYAATFGLGQMDSVAVTRGKTAPRENVEWWNGLCRWRPTGIKGARSICGSIKKAPGAIHVFALSPFYLDAISEDLGRARCHLTDPNNLIVVSTGKLRHGDLNGHVIPAPAELQTILGGALVSLNVRVVAEVLNSIPESELALPVVREFISALASKASPRILPERERASDRDVVRFIRQNTHGNRRPSYSKLLRSFRDSGRACEMKRFKALFENSVKR